MKTQTLLLAALFALVPCAQAQDWGEEPDPEELAQLEAQAEAHRAYSLRLAETLAKTGAARELAYAALLRYQALAPADDAPPTGDAPSRPAPRDQRAETWLRAAAAKAGDDVLANQLVIAAAAGGDSALRAEAAWRWQAADPGNLAPLFHTGTTADALLREARRTDRFDTRVYDVVRWIMSTQVRHPPDAQERAVLAVDGTYDVEAAAAVTAMSQWAAFAMPGYAVLLACRDDALRATPTRASDCRHVAGLLMEHSSGAIDRVIGLDMLRAVAGSASERVAIEAQRRRVDWQMLEWGRVSASQPDGGIAQFVRLLSDPSIRTEQQLLERVLREAGVPLEPPPGWSPPGRR